MNRVYRAVRRRDGHMPRFAEKMRLRTGRRVSRHAILSFLLATLAAGASAQQAAVPKWGPHVDVEGTLGDTRDIGEANVLIPMMQDERTLLFADLRTRFDDDDNREGNVGIGMRRMFANGWNLGAYGYFDRRRSESGNYFSQVSPGVEALGSDWDFRANAYFPIGDKTREWGTGGGPSSASLVGGSVQVVTPGSTTWQERALKGFDAEAGWRVPFFDAASDRQLRIYLGGYRFSDDGMTVDGPRLRVELAMERLPILGNGAALFLDAGTQHDDARGTQDFISLRLRIPLGREGGHRQTLTLQERRMTDPVVRDVDIVTRRRVMASTPTMVETADATAGGRSLAVIDDASTSGAELNTALAAAGADSTVILSGNFNTATTVTLQPGQTLMGRGTLEVATPSGHTATLVTPGATIAGSLDTTGGNIAAVSMANDSTLSGMIVSSAYAGGVGSVYGVEIDGKSNVAITNSAISATGSTGTSIALRLLDGASNATITGNTLTAANTNSSGGAIGLQMVSGSTASVNGNVVRADTSGATRYAFYVGDSTPLSGSTGNTVLSGACAGYYSHGSIGYVDAGGASHTCDPSAPP